MSFLSETGFMYTWERSEAVRVGPITGRPAVFVHSTRINSVISLLFILAMGACGNFGSCGACGATQPLPGGRLPVDQTVEGGAQIRVTPQGFQKLTAILPGVLNQQ